MSSYEVPMPNAHGAFIASDAQRAFIASDAWKEINKKINEESNRRFFPTFWKDLPFLFDIDIILTVLNVILKKRETFDAYDRASRNSCIKQLKVDQQIWQKIYDYVCGKCTQEEVIHHNDLLTEHHHVAHRFNRPLFLKEQQESTQFELAELCEKYARLQQEMAFCGSQIAEVQQQLDSITQELKQ